MRVVELYAVGKLLTEFISPVTYSGDIPGDHFQNDHIDATTFRCRAATELLTGLSGILSNANLVTVR